MPPNAPAPTETWVRRRIAFPSVDIATYDSAWAEIHLKRNEELLTSRKVVDAFVYETAPARFGKPVTPFIQCPEDSTHRGSDRARDVDRSPSTSA